MQQMRERKQAAALMLLSSTSFALMSMVVKLSATGVTTMQQVFFRNLVSLLLVGLVIRRKKLPFWGEKRYQLPLFARSFFGFVGIIMLFYATANARQADVSILSRTSPIWTTVFAALLLREKISKVQLPVIFLCLAGAVVAMRPSFDSNILPLLLAAATAVVSGLAYSMIAFCKGKVHPLTVIFHFSLFSTVAGFFLMLPGFVMPSPRDLVMLLLIGVFAAGGQIGLTYAYQKAPASEVSIYDYVGIVISMILGDLVFGEPMTWSSTLGGILITGSALWSYLYNRRHPTGG
ncbi:DMT family transporter [uncultured Oscillibacter sp.]|uniref:DMT family transporter n=1 Tax=uncultured Oscillibacter sp. TaxID=876091 RepID=UPI00280513E8|nr:DMT family transporter [uncultured Oscillibacter sp.]